MYSCDVLCIQVLTTYTVHETLTETFSALTWWGFSFRMSACSFLLLLSSPLTPSVPPFMRMSLDDTAMVGGSSTPPEVAELCGGEACSLTFWRTVLQYVIDHWQVDFWTQGYYLQFTMQYWCHISPHYIVLTYMYMYKLQSTCFYPPLPPKYSHVHVCVHAHTSIQLTHTYTFLFLIHIHTSTECMYVDQKGMYMYMYMYMQHHVQCTLIHSLCLVP